MDHKNKLTMLLYGARVLVCGLILFKPTWSFPLAKSLWSCERNYQLQISTTQNNEWGILSKKLHNQTSSSDNSELLSMESSSIKSAILFKFIVQGLGPVKPLTILAQSFVHIHSTLFTSLIFSLRFFIPSLLSGPPESDDRFHGSISRDFQLICRAVC